MCSGRSRRYAAMVPRTRSEDCPVFILRLVDSALLSSVEHSPGVAASPCSASGLLDSRSVALTVKVYVLRRRGDRKVLLGFPRGVTFVRNSVAVEGSPFLGAAMDWSEPPIYAANSRQLGGVSC